MAGGASNCYEVLRVRGLPMAQTRPVLRTRRSGNPKLGHCATAQAAWWGRLGGRVASGAEDMTN